MNIFIIYIHILLLGVQYSTGVLRLHPLQCHMYTTNTVYKMLLPWQHSTVWYGVYVPSSEGWHLLLLQSNVQLLEDVPAGRWCAVVSNQSRGEEQFRGSTIKTQLRNVWVWGNCTWLQLLTVQLHIFKLRRWKWNALNKQPVHHLSSKKLWGEQSYSI